MKSAKFLLILLVMLLMFVAGAASVVVVGMLTYKVGIFVDINSGEQKTEHELLFVKFTTHIESTDYSRLVDKYRLRSNQGHDWRVCRVEWHRIWGRFGTLSRRNGDYEGIPHRLRNIAIEIDIQKRSLDDNRCMLLKSLDLLKKGDRRSLENLIDEYAGMTKKDK